MSFSLSGFAPDPARLRGAIARRIRRHFTPDVTTALRRRLCAFLVDAFILGLVGWAAALGIFLLGIITTGLAFLMFHIIPLLPFAYYGALLPTGGTVGQRLFGIALRDDADPQRAPGIAEALVWTLLLWVSLALALVPCLLAVVYPRQRAAHDLLTRLVIIRA